MNSGIELKDILEYIKKMTLKHISNIIILKMN